MLGGSRVRPAGLRTVLLFVIAAASAAALVSGPPGALALPGDIVVRKPAAGQATATPGARGAIAPAPGAPDKAAAPPPRREGPHFLTKPGSRPAPIIASRSKVERGHVDLTTRARDLAAARAALGPAANRIDQTTSVPGQDLVRIAILRIDFRNDREGANSSGDGKFDLRPRDNELQPFDPTPHDRKFWQAHGEALTRYWRAQTNGRTEIETVVYPSQPDSAFHLADMADYGPWKFSPEIYEAAVKLFHDCINAADTTETIPWSTFDRVIIVHAGGDLQSDVNQDSPLDIPTFTIGVPDSDAVVVGPANADTIFGAAILPETIRQDGYEGVVNAVIAHESGHLIYGFRDVYDVASGLPVVGYWNLMDVGNLLGNVLPAPNGEEIYVTGFLPPSVDPWQRRLIYPDVPSARFPNWGQDESLINSSEGYEVLQVPLSGEEYLLLENRLDDLNGNHSLTLKSDPQSGVILGPAIEDTLEYDYLVPGPGILAWHIDESVADYFGPRADPGYGLNVNPARFGVEIVEADGLDDLGDFNSPFALGVPSDTWKAGTTSRLNFDTVPRLRTHSRTNPHVDLEFTSAPGSDMTLRATRQWDLPGWPVTVEQFPEGISPVVGVFGDDLNPRVAWSTGGSIRVRELDGSVPGAWPSDIAFASPTFLGAVAIVPRASGGAVLAVATTGPPTPSSGVLYTVDRVVGGTTNRSIPFPVSITAGPVASPTAPDRVLVGLANGRVCEYRTDTEAVRDLAGASASAVTGLSIDGNDFAWADAGGNVGRGRFADGTAGSALQSSLAPEPLAAGHRLQPMLVRTALPAGGASPFESHLIIVDRTAGSAREIACAGLDPTSIEPWQGRELGEAVGPPAIDDLDGDGLPEIAFITASGRVGYWNMNGATSPGWPPSLEREGFPSAAGPVTMRAPTVTADPILIAPLGNGVTVGLDHVAKNVDGFPLGFSVGTRGTPALVTVGCSTRMYAAGGDTLLYGIALFGAPEACPALEQFPRTAWANDGGDAGRSYASPTIFTGSGGGGSGGTSAIVDGSLVCYPNPARREPITFAFRLGSPGRVTISVYDAAARLVERIERDGTTSENAITWDPVGRTSGLYVARIEANGSVVTQPFALVR